MRIKLLLNNNKNPYGTKKTVMYKKEKTKKFEIDVKNMGVDIDKNEYREIVLSETNRPDAVFNVKKYKNSTK